ncbi:MAG: hypothetical protein WCH85_06445 [Methanomicrobiales archaeon]
MTGQHHANRVINEAALIAREHRLYVMKVIGEGSPVNIMASDKVGQTCICAIRSRVPINDAHAVMEDYGPRIAALSDIDIGTPCNRELWITSRPHGWIFYEVVRGNIARMDAPFTPQIRYTWNGSFIARSADHPIRSSATPEP